MRILKFEEYTRLTESKCFATFRDVCKTLEPYGWICQHKPKGDGITFRKNEFTCGGNLKHNASKDENRYVDINTLDAIRTYLIQEFYKTGDPSTINAIDWVIWCLKDPFTKELKEYDKETGKKKSEIELLSKIKFVEQLFKNVGIIKNEDGEYNLCRSESDMRPLLDRWYPLYLPSKKLGGKMCLGYDVEYEYDVEDEYDAEDGYNVENSDSKMEFGTHLFVIKEDGTIGAVGEDNYYVVESVKKI